MLSVQTKKTVRISTNYRIEDEGNNVDSEIESYLYETLKPVLTQNITLETFIDRDNHTGGSIVSSQKVGPSIADDIKTGAVYSVVIGTARYRFVYLDPFPQHRLQYRFYRSSEL